MILHAATTNAGKLREFRLIVERASAGRFHVEPASGIGDLPSCPETGATFEENAVSKALYYSRGAGARAAGGFLFADDSGLEVHALSDAPGILSARYAGEQASDGANNQLLLERMTGIEQRTARFVCVAALARDGRLIGTFRGVVEGLIASSPRGREGFGYDPLFYHPRFGCTFGEVALERKMEVSHRGQALRAMVEFLNRKAELAD